MTDENRSRMVSLIEARLQLELAADLVREATVKLEQVPLDLQPDINRARKALTELGTTVNRVNILIGKIPS